MYSISILDPDDQSKERKFGTVEDDISGSKKAYLRFIDYPLVCI